MVGAREERTLSSTAAMGTRERTQAACAGTTGVATPRCRADEPELSMTTELIIVVRCEVDARWCFDRHQNRYKKSILIDCYCAA